MSWSWCPEGLIECVQDFLTSEELSAFCSVCSDWNVKGPVYSHIKRRHGFDKVQRVFTRWLSCHAQNYIEEPVSLFLDLPDARPPWHKTLEKNQMYHPIPFKTFIDECMSTISQEYLMVSLSLFL